MEERGRLEPVDMSSLGPWRVNEVIAIYVNASSHNLGEQTSRMKFISETVSNTSKRNEFHVC